jgi:signal peptidase
MKMRVVRKVLSGVIVAAGLCLAATMLLPVAFGYQRYVITSGSMTGTYDQGSIVFDKTVPDFGPGGRGRHHLQPAAVSGETGLITHRIYSIKNHGKDGFSYRTKGDANPAPDPWRFQLDQPTQATVAFAIPYLGYGIAALSMLPIRMIIIGLPALLIAIALIARMWREAGEEARARNAAILARQPASAAAQQPLQPMHGTAARDGRCPVTPDPAPPSQGARSRHDLARPVGNRRRTRPGGHRGMDHRVVGRKLHSVEIQPQQQLHRLFVVPGDPRRERQLHGHRSRQPGHHRRRLPARRRDREVGRQLGRRRDPHLHHGR